MEINKSDINTANNDSVVDRIITSFINVLAIEDGYAEIAGRLRIAILDERDFSEAALDYALFDDIQS